MHRTVTAAALVLLGAGVAVSQAPNAPPPLFPRASGLPVHPPAAVAEMYVESCASCHGVNLAGGRGPSLFNPALLNQRTDDQIRQVIQDGVPEAGMPGFKDKYRDEQIWQLISFLRFQSTQLAAKRAPVADPHGQVLQTAGQTVRVEVVARDLVHPWGIDWLPDGRTLVTERPGRLRIIDRRGRLLPEPVKGTPKVFEVQDGGLFDVGVHPDYRRNGWIYLSFSELVPGYSGPPPAAPPPGQRRINPPSMTVLIRGRINRRNEWVDEQVLYRAPPELYTRAADHYGSRFLFDGKGHVFYSIGERGSIPNAQDLGSPLGKVHRINDDGTVPADNPFIGRPGVVPTIWSYGHRNPEGLTWDPASGHMWESEHGPTGGDEINLVERGKNYGWGVITMGIQPGMSARSAPGMEQPAAYYNPTIAPSGIAFAKGGRYPGWSNSLFVAGLAGQQLRRLSVEGTQVTGQEVVFDAFGRTRAVEQGPDGLLYVLLQNPSGATAPEAKPGMVIRLVPVPQNERSSAP